MVLKSSLHEGATPIIFSTLIIFSVLSSVSCFIFYNNKNESEQHSLFFYPEFSELVCKMKVSPNVSPSFLPFSFQFLVTFSNIFFLIGFHFSIIPPEIPAHLSNNEYISRKY